MRTKRDVAALLLLKASGEFLLQYRDANAPVYPNFWGLFGGGIEDNETPEEALKREAYEELRYFPKSAKPVLVVNYEDQIIQTYGKKYYYSEICEAPEKLELHEGQAMDWFKSEDLSRINTTVMNRKIIPEILSKMKGKEGVSQ